MPTLDLLDQAKLYRQKADQLLEESQIVDLLKSYGDLQKMGSYDLGVMLNPDIDFNIINPGFDRDKVKNILNVLVDKTRFGSYHFFDWVKFKNPEFPSGYYIGLQTDFEGEKWKIDIWFLHQPDNRAMSLTEAVRNSSKDVKKAIMQIKLYRNEHGLKIQSFDIYKAVIENEVKSVEEFVASQSANYSKKPPQP